MSKEALLWAWAQKIPDHITHKLLIALADRANAKYDHTAWPSKKHLGNMVHVGRRCLMKHTRELEKLGYITCEKQYRDNGSCSSNMYGLNMHRGSDTCPTLGSDRSPPLGPCVCPPLGSDTSPPYNTSTNTRREYYNELSTGKPGPEDDLGTVQDTMDGFDPLSEEEIRERVHRDEDGYYTPSGCGYVWRHFHRTFEASGFLRELLISDWSILRKSYDRLGEAVWTDAVKEVMKDWIAFTKYAKDKGGAFQLPQTPKVLFFAKFCNEAAEFASIQNTEGVAGVVRPRARVTEPRRELLTNPVEKDKKADGGMTYEEILEANKEFVD